MVKSFLSKAGAAVACACAAGAAGALLLARDFEAVGFGLIVPLFLLPSIFGYAGVELWKPTSRLKHGVFFFPFIALEMFFLFLAFQDFKKEYSDGSGDMALLMAGVLLPAAVAAYSVCLRMRGRPRDR